MIGFKVEVIEWDPTQPVDKISPSNVKQSMTFHKEGEGQQFSVGEGLTGQEIFVYFRALQARDFLWEMINQTPESGIEVDELQRRTTSSSGETVELTVVNRVKGKMVTAVSLDKL